MASEYIEEGCMKKSFLPALLLLSTVFALMSCGGAAQYIYEKEAITLNLKSDPQLNLYRNSPHTLMVCLYQFRDPNMYNQLMDEKDGLQKLLECSRFDASVTSAKSFVMSPNKQKTEKVDRVEGTKYVAVVAGYYNLVKENVTYFLPVPIGSFSNKPKPMTIDLYLGAQGIKKTEKK
jgi:type VI secretion system VasD/TssJ family lipoprotein